MKPKKARKPVPPRYNELLAAAIVNTVLGTHTVGHDDNTEEGKVDFNLAPSSTTEATIALEVSSHVDSKLYAVWNGLQKQYQEQANPNLTKGWFVEFTADSQVRGKAARQLANLLEDFEKRGVNRVSVRMWEDAHDWSTGVPDEQHRSDVAAIQSLGINAVAQIGDSADVVGQVFPASLATGVGSATADRVPTYVEEFLAGTAGDNKIKKLGRVRTLEPHLFLWADSTHMSIGVALDKRFIPSSDPHVPGRDSGGVAVELRLC